MLISSVLVRIPQGFASKRIPLNIVLSGYYCVGLIYFFLFHDLFPSIALFSQFKFFLIYSLQFIMNFLLS